MITGIVNDELEATISIRLMLSGTEAVDVEAIVDTGFDGWLTLPNTMGRQRALPFIGRVRGLLADGSETTIHLYEATVEWDGAHRPVHVSATDGAPLVGMLLLSGFDLSVAVRPGGAVRILALEDDRSP